MLTEACRVGYFAVSLIIRGSELTVNFFDVGTQLNAPDLQMCKTSAFIDVLGLPDDHLIKCI